MRFNRQKQLQQLRGAIWPAAIIGLIVIAGLGYQAFRTAEHYWIVLAIVMTVFAVKAAFAFKNALRLHEFGNETHGEIHSFEAARRRDSTTVVIDYYVENERHIHRVAINDAKLNKLAVGGRVKLLVDPENAKRALVIDFAPDSMVLNPRL